MDSLLKQYGRILNWCHACGFAPFQWSHKSKVVLLRTSSGNKWVGWASRVTILFPLIQTFFMIFQSIRAVTGLSGDMPVFRKMQMVYYATGYIVFSVNFLPVFQHGGAAIAMVMNNLMRIQATCAAGKWVVNSCFHYALLKTIKPFSMFLKATWAAERIDGAQKNWQQHLFSFWPWEPFSFRCPTPSRSCGIRPTGNASLHSTPMLMRQT